MQLVNNTKELEKYLNEAVEVSNSKPILLDSYLTDAVEVDVDVVSDGKEIEIGGILQHIEQAGIHSGDSACSLPPYSLSDEVQGEMKKQAINIARELNVIGLMNIQFAIKDEEVFIIEVNPRASRTVPFISKAIGNSLAKVASKAMIGKSLRNQKFTSTLPNTWLTLENCCAIKLCFHVTCSCNLQSLLEKGIVPGFGTERDCVFFHFS